MNLHQEVKKIITEIFEKTCDSNQEGKVPFIISENDLCCELYSRLNPRCENTLTTEWTTENSGRGNMKHDLIIFDKKSADYKLKKSGKPENFGMPENLSIKKLIAVFELKNTWTPSKNTIIKNFKEDIKKLKEVDVDYDVGSNKFFIYFDFAGKLTEKEVGSFKQEGIKIIYADIKNKELIII
ncbi:hypothetical protein ISS07_00370 [Candidatus Woesearchaeota archaeon]|nr:hypothetical protein [Candidatus Woesearchaeota archaeon]